MAPGQGHGRRHANDQKVARMLPLPPSHRLPALLSAPTFWSQRWHLNLLKDRREAEGVELPAPLATPPDFGLFQETFEALVSRQVAIGFQLRLQERTPLPISLGKCERRAAPLALLP